MYARPRDFSIDELEGSFIHSLLLQVILRLNSGSGCLLIGYFPSSLSTRIVPHLISNCPAILASSLTSYIPHMSKKFKSQASSSRAAAGGFGSVGGFSSAFSSQGREPSALTYIAEPPDLSRIAEQQLVIAFKNLLKKDEITRTKALEELRDYVTSVEGRGGTLDDGFLQAWVSIHFAAD